MAHEDWSAKGKFPPTIKPILAKTALVAIEHDEYDDDFFNLMPTLFPYNKFTMSKLIKRTVFLEHTQMLQQRQEKLLAELAKISKDGFKKAEEDWQNAIVAWDRRQERVRMAKKLGLGFNNGEASPAPPTRPGTPTGDDLENKGGDADVDGDKDGEKGEDGKADRDAHPPQKKYRMTDQMKNIVWELVLLSNECCRLENEKKYALSISFMTSFPNCSSASWRIRLSRYRSRACAKCCTRRLSQCFQKGGCRAVKLVEMVSFHVLMFLFYR